MKSHEPAFPRAGFVMSHVSESEFDNTPQAGITLRAYFAARAPEEIPHWFKPVYPPFSGPQLPSKEGMSEEDREAVNAWLNDPCFDLPPHLQWFSDQNDAYCNAEHEHKRECEVHRYFAWRWHYADRMAEMGEHGGPLV